jgi:hypothetical protein
MKSTKSKALNNLLSCIKSFNKRKNTLYHDNLVLSLHLLYHYYILLWIRNYFVIEPCLVYDAYTMSLILFNCWLYYYCILMGILFLYEYSFSISLGRFVMNAGRRVNRRTWCADCVHCGTVRFCTDVRILCFSMPDTTADTNVIQWFCKICQIYHNYFLNDM